MGQQVLAHTVQGRKIFRLRPDTQAPLLRTVLLRMRREWAIFGVYVEEVTPEKETHHAITGMRGQNVFAGDSVENNKLEIVTRNVDPLIAALGGSDVSGLGFHVISGNPATFLDFGAVITAAINFLMIAAVVYFVIVMPMNKMKELQERRRGIEKEEEAPAPTDVELLTEIRDLLQKS